MRKRICRAVSPEEELTEYEKIRKRNMEEIKNAMAKSGTLNEIKELNHQIKYGTSRKQINMEFGNVTKKSFGVKVSNLGPECSKNTRGKLKNKSKPLQPPEGEKKRILRKRYDEDEDYEPPKSKRVVRNDSINYNENSSSSEYSGDELQSFKRKRGLPRRAAVRAARKMSYAEIYIPSADEFIFCDYPECQDEYFEGCSIDDHEVAFVDEIDARTFLKVEKSSINGAGRGVFNGFEETIPMGIIFGPYGGPIIDIEEYESKKESGYAWELMDPEKKKVIGYVDPGHYGQPNPIEYIFAMINSATCKEDQNIVSVQYRSQVVYRVCKEIPYGKELLTYYGDNYSTHLGINPENYHLGKKKFACKQCEMSFRGCSGLYHHIKAVHEKVRYPCPYCKSSHINYIAKYKSDLQRHIKAVHQKLTFHECSICNKKFFSKSHAQRHYRKVHLGIK